MTKKPIKKSPSKKDFFVPAHSKLFEPLNVSTGNKNRRFRRTLTFININRKRATQFCTLKNANAKSRRLSLGPLQNKKQNNNNQKEFKSITDTIKRFKNIKQIKQQQMAIDSLQQLRKHTFYLNLDQNLKEFIENPSNSHILNNKVSF